MKALGFFLLIRLFSLHRFCTHCRSTFVEFMFRSGRFSASSKGHGFNLQNLGFLVIMVNSKNVFLLVCRFGIKCGNTSKEIPNHWLHRIFSSEFFTQSRRWCVAV